MLNIITVITGYIQENCYIVHNGVNALIIDPGANSEDIINQIEQNKLNVCAILITHYHFDHIGALEDIKNKYKVPVIDYKSKKIQNINEFNFNIIENFGHTLDSVSFYFTKEKIMFSGDFIFKETIGIYDDENEKIMVNSLKEFKKLDKDIDIYPGHGNKTSVSHELENNPFLKGI